MTSYEALNIAEVIDADIQKSLGQLTDPGFIFIKMCYHLGFWVID